MCFLLLICRYVFFSGSLFRTEDVGSMVYRIVHAYHPPQANSTEAETDLHYAWALIDSYNEDASVFKWVTKCTYAFLLIAGALTSAIAVDKGNGLVPHAQDFHFNFYFAFIRADDVDESDPHGGWSRFFVIILSLLVAVVVTFVNLCNPAQQWRQLRGKTMPCILPNTPG